MNKDLRYWLNRALGTEYKITCPFCGKEHKQRSHINVICSCGAKFYYRDLLWLNRKNGKTKLGEPQEGENDESVQNFPNWRPSF